MRQGFTAKGGEGKLVRDILDTKDELDKGQKEEAVETEEKETGIILGRGRKKGGDGVKKEEIQRLREVRPRSPRRERERERTWWAHTAGGKAAVFKPPPFRSR